MSESIDLPVRERKVRETQVVAACRLAINRMPGVRCTRNNTGKSPKPCPVCLPKLCRGCLPRLCQPIAFGLGAGGPDLVGFLRVLTLPVWFGVEVKRPRELGGKGLEKDQRLWHAEAKRHGVEVIVARSADEAVSGVTMMRRVYEERVRDATTRS